MLRTPCVKDADFKGSGVKRQCRPSTAYISSNGVVGVNVAPQYRPVMKGRYLYDIMPSKAIVYIYIQTRAGRIIGCYNTGNIRRST